MTIYELAIAVKREGLRLTVGPGGRLRIRGPASPELQASLAEHKTEILALLTTGDPLLDRVCDVLDCDPRSLERRRVVPFNTPAARQVRAKA